MKEFLLWIFVYIPAIFAGIQLGIMLLALLFTLLAVVWDKLKSLFTGNQENI